MTTPDDPPVVRLRARLEYENRFVAVYDDDVRFDDGSEGRYLRVVESAGRPGVAVLARTRDHVALVRVFRYPLGAWEWGIPRGFAQADNPETTARGELIEELGGAPDELTPLGTLTPNSGLLASTVHVFDARYAATVAAPVDTTEVHGVRWVTGRQLRDEIADGRIVDGFTIAAATLAAAHGAPVF